MLEQKDLEKSNDLHQMSLENLTGGKRLSAVRSRKKFRHQIIRMQTCLHTWLISFLLISKDWTACKTHSTPSSPSKHIQNLFAKKFVVKFRTEKTKNTKHSFQREVPKRHSFFSQQMGKDHARPAIGLRGWQYTSCKRVGKKKGGNLQPLQGPKKGSSRPPHP